MRIETKARIINVECETMLHTVAQLERLEPSMDDLTNKAKIADAVRHLNIAISLLNTIEF